MAARNDFESALADLDRACALEPASAGLFAQRGEIQLALRHPVKAREDFDQALKLDPAQADAQLRRAVLRLTAKDRDGALADLDALDRTLPAQAPMRLSMSALFLTMEQPARTVTQLDQWLAAHPNDSARSGALNTRCWARVTQGSELDKALDDCDAAIDREPRNAAYLGNRGWLFFRMARYPKALQDFDRSVELRPSNAWVLYGRGLTKTKLGDAAQGDADLTTARKLQPGVDASAERMGIVADGAIKH